MITVMKKENYTDLMVILNRLFCPVLKQQMWVAMAIIVFIFIAPSPYSLAPGSFAGESGLISISKPEGTTVTEKEQILEGTVEESFVKTLSLTVEPFIAREGEKKYSRRVQITKGRFFEKIKLSPGLNLIKLSPSGGKAETVQPIFLVTADKKTFENIDKWGSESQIVFLSPNETKVNTSKVTLKGMVADQKAKALDVVILEMADLSTVSENAVQKQQIAYKKVNIKKQKFSFNADLSEGLNIILVKISGKPTKTDNLQIKSVIYEKVNPNIVLNDPEIKNGKLIITGKIDIPSLKTVEVKATALVETGETRQIKPETLFERIVNVEKDGCFSLALPWEEKPGFTIKSSPNIYVSASDKSATKTLIKWW